MERNKTPSCHVHQKTSASHFCLRHERNVCFHCVRSNKHCDVNCPLIEVKLNADVSRLREHVKTKLQENEEIIEKEEASKNRLVQEARDYYDRLVNRMKESTDNMVEKFQDEFNKCMKTLKDDNTTLIRVQDTINSRFESLVSTSNVEEQILSDQVQSVIKEHSDTVDQLEIYTDMAIPTWQFKKDDTYNKILDKPIGFFQSVHSYEKLDEAKNKSWEVLYSRLDEEQDKPSVVKRPQSDSSRLPTVPPRNDRRVSEGDVDERHVRKEEPLSSNIQKTGNDKHAKQGSTASLPMKKRLAPCPNSSFEVKDHDDEKGPCSYDTVRIFSDKLLLVIDSTHKKVLIMHYDGSIEAITNSKETTHVAGMDGDKFAMLSKKSKSIQCCTHKSGKILQVEKINLKLDNSHPTIIGFEFDAFTETFALITPKGVTLLSKDGKITDRVGIEEITGHVDAAKLKGTYIFPERKVFLLHTENKTLKCCMGKSSGETSAEVLWKKKINDDVSPLDVNANGGTIFVLLTSCVLLFSSDGNPLNKYGAETGCASFRAFCVDPNYKVLVLTANATDKQSSRKVFIVGQ